MAKQVLLPPARQIEDAISPSRLLNQSTAHKLQTDLSLQKLAAKAIHRYGDTAKSAASAKLSNKNKVRRRFMRTGALGLILAFLVVGCTKNDLSKNDQPSQTATVEADNSGRNVRGRNATKTSGDQFESEADRTISQNIRQAIVADQSVSTNGKNVKIITVDGTVTLRGPVRGEKEKTNIVGKAQQVAGVRRVDNQLEIAN
jgi:hyperosmotically inducible protein